MVATAYQKLNIRCLLRELDLTVEHVTSDNAAYLRAAGIPVVLGQRMPDVLDAAGADKLRALAKALLAPVRAVS